MSIGHAPSRTRGADAEAAVHARLRSALPADYHLYANVPWLGRTARNRQLRDGEADLIVAHPDRGILVIETKAGEIRRDAKDRWWAGPNLLDPPPHRQAAENKHALVAKLVDLPAWPAGLDPIAGHAVALPGVDLASAGPRLRLPPDLDEAIVLDGEKLATDASARQAVDRAFDLWSENAVARRPPGPLGIKALDELIETPLDLRRILRREIDEGESEVVQATELQRAVMRSHGRIRRAEIAGCAGSGKTMLAVEKARALAREGYRTLLVCFNQPLARMLADELEAGGDPRVGEYARVSTFHQLAEDLGREAGVLPPKPEPPPPPEWWNETLPTALLEAAGRLGPRFHAIVVDEGQDFEADWFATLQLLLFDEAGDVFWVFHDPAQALFRDDVVASLGLSPVDLDLNCRNSGPIHELAERFREGGTPSSALREDGREPEIVEAEPGRATTEALGRVLHRLRVEEGVRPWDIAVLVGGSLAKSDVWRQRRFGNEVLWNGQVDDSGQPLGLAASQVAEQPDDTILVDSIRRFKGLERAVVVLVELRPDDERVRRLLHVGITRARHHVVAVVPPELAQALGMNPSSWTRVGSK